ncbi:MAG TPA: hypothetical protein PLW86_02675 [Rhodocyclaceae bacterium]|nr:hypothetical protein [Rhodocyclaceae bacterium]
MQRRGALFFLVLLWLAGCAEVPEKAAEAEPEPAAVSKVSKPRLESQPLKHLAGRKLAPMPVRPLNVSSSCSRRDEAGTVTRLNLRVRNAEVKTFSARVDIPKHGACRFEAAQFAQQAKLPQVLLAARNGSGCTVRMWEQGAQTTIAFSGCAAACDKDSSDYLWPILVDTRSGRCS